GPASEPCADAHAEDHRVKLGLAGVHAVDLHVGVGLEVARIGARKPGRGDVDVHADRRHRTLGGLHADAIAGGRGALVVVVGLVVAEADERAHGAVGGAEAVLAAQRVGLGVDAADLAAAGVDALAVAVRGPGFNAPVVGDVVGHAKRGRALAVELGTGTGDLGVAGRFHHRIAGDDRDALVGGAAGVLGKGGRGDGNGQRGRNQDLHGGHGGVSSLRTYGPGMG